MSSPLRWPDAALAGLACSMRSMSGPAALAVHGAIPSPWRVITLAGAAGELAVDKSSIAIDRTEIPGLAGRVGSGALTGWKIGGPVGGVVAGVSAAAGTFSTWRIRKLVVSATGLPDAVVAAGEDIVCYAAIAAATRDLDGDAPRDAVAMDQVASAVGTTPAAPSLLENAGKGLIAGLAGTATMTLAQGAEFVLTSAEPSDAPAEVASNISAKLGLGRIKRKRQRRWANQGMHWLYGSSWGIPYGVFAASSRTRPELTGPIFGLIVWGVGLAQQPASGVADPPWKRSLQSLGSEALFHVVYGVGAGAALRVLRNR